MEIWVLVIIAIRSKLEEAVKRAQNKIMKIALNPTIDALKQSAIISDLINKKNMLVNLKILYDRIEDELKGEKLEFLKEFVSIRENLEEFCVKNVMTPATVVERVEEFAYQGAAPLKKLGLTVGKMDEDYGDLPLVALSIMSIKRIVKQVKSKSNALWSVLKNNAHFNCVAL